MTTTTELYTWAKSRKDIHSDHYKKKQAIQKHTVQLPTTAELLRNVYPNIIIDGDTVVQDTQGSTII
jgi:hypothetical protein